LTNALDDGGLRGLEAERLTAFATAASPADSVARRSKLQNHHRLFELRDGTEDLPNMRACRISIGGGHVRSISS